MRYQQWSVQHQDWVRLHPDRAHFFAAHPESAEKYRNEWQGWHEANKFETWAELHPGWTATHKERSEYFRAHPEAAEQNKHEWWEHKENKHEYSKWAKTHQ